MTATRLQLPRPFSMLYQPIKKRHADFETETDENSERLAKKPKDEDQSRSGDSVPHGNVTRWLQGLSNENRGEMEVNPAEDCTKRTAPDKGRPSRRRKTCFTSRQCLVYETVASKISRDDIRKCVDVEYDCPSNVNCGQELQGGTKKDILQDLLRSMSEKGVKFPAENYDDFQKMTSSSIPNDHREAVHNVFKPIIELLDELDFHNDTSEEMIDSYVQLRKKLLQGRTSKLIVPSGVTRYPIEALHRFVTSALDQDELVAHTHLTEFFRMILEPVRRIDEESGVSHHVSVSGTGKALPMTLKNSNLEEGEPENISVMAKPDLLFEIVTHIKDYEDSSESSSCLSRPRICVFRAFCMEFQTTSIRSSVMSGSDHSKPSSRKACSSSDGKRRKKSKRDEDWKPYKSIGRSPSQAYIPFNPRLLDKMRTQHFMELLAMMKSKDNEGIVNQVHAFGFVVVMHRVYVTALQVKGPRHLDHFNCRSVFVQECKNCAHDMNFHMVCCKYFNIFKAEHFKAFLEFVFYLVFKQNKDYMFF